VGRVEHGEGEAGAGGEVGGVAFEVGEVALEGHALRGRPGAVGVAGGGADVLDAGGPGGQIGRVVLRAQRLQAGALASEGGGRLGTGRDERWGVHGPTVEGPTAGANGVFG